MSEHDDTNGPAYSANIEPPAFDTINLMDEALLDDTEVMDEIRSMRYLDTKIMFALAVGCGWTWHRHKAFIFGAADGTKMEMPTNANLNAKTFRQRINTLVRHRAPGSDLFGVVEHIIGSPYIKVDPSRARVLRDAVASAPPVESTPVPASSGGNHEEPESIPVKATSRKVRIVKEEPWNAHRNSRGDTYPSPAAMERTWSNGTVDYACRWEGCNYTDDSPNSTVKHYGAHKRGQGTSPQPKTDGVDESWVPNPRRATRIRNLSREIDGAFGAALAAGLALDPDWLAQWIIDHRIEALPGDTGVSNEPLSAEEILDRVAALVDRGRGKVLREQIDTLQKQVDGYMDERDTIRDDMQAQLDTTKADMQAALDAAIARADKVTGDWNAVVDMLIANAPGVVIPSPPES